MGTAIEQKDAWAETIRHPAVVETEGIANIGIGAIFVEAFDHSTVEDLTLERGSTGARVTNDKLATWDVRSDGTGHTVHAVSPLAVSDTARRIGVVDVNRRQVIGELDRPINVIVE